MTHAESKLEQEGRKESLYEEDKHKNVVYNMLAASE
jgi:hypothetical protein